MPKNTTGYEIYIPDLGLTVAPGGTYTLTPPKPTTEPDAPVVTKEN